MSKKWFLPFFIALFIILGIGYSTFVFKTEKFLDKNSIKFITEINPKFNPKVENYYTSDCIDNNVQIEIDPKLDFKKEVKKPITIISISYNKIFNKKYYFTCVDEKVAPIIVTNAEGKRNEFNLSDEIVLGGQANGQYNGSISLRDSLGIPIWWLSPNSKPIANKNYLYLRDPKLIENGTKVLFVASKKPAGAFSSDGEYLIYDLKSHKIVKTYTGAQKINSEGTLDFHDLQVLPNGEAVGMRYVKRTDVDLTSIGIPKGIEVLDSEIVILNSDGTQKTKFSILDKINLNEITLGQKAYFIPTVAPVDVIHMNSIEVIGDAVLISSRHLDALHKISLKDGSIIWKLGGNSKTKYDLNVTNLYGAFNQFNKTIDFSHLFSGQHDARILENGNLSVYDNGTTANRNPRVLVFKIDEKNKSATIVKVITGSSQSISSCCGTARELEDGAWMVNWGGKFDAQTGGFANGVSSTVLPNGVATRILLRPANVFSYRVIPYYLSNEQINLFRNDLEYRE